MCDLKEFLYSILRHWKVLVVVSLVSVLIGSGYYYFDYKKDTAKFIGNSDEENPQETQQNIEKENWSQSEKVYVGQLKFVGVGNANATSDVIRDAYLAQLLGTDFYKYMQENYFEKHSLRYVREVVVPSNGNLANYLGVDVFCCGKEKCEDVLRGIIQYVNEKSAEMNGHLGEHELFMLVNAVEEATLEEHHEKVEKIEAVIADDIVAEEVRSFSVKRMAIYAILCIVFANACTCLIFILKDTLGDSIYNPNMLAKSTNSEILGDFSGEQIKGKIDKKIYDILINGKHLSEKGVANLVNYKLTHKYMDKCECLLVGNLSKESLDEKVKILKSVSEIELKFSSLELIDENAERLEELNENQVIVYVVQRFADNRKEVIQNINIYKELGMEIAGILFV